MLKPSLRQVRAVLGALGLAACATASAVQIPLTLVDLGASPVGPATTRLFSADLTGLGITEIGSLTIVDSNSGVGGSAGIFSGFDLDALFLDTDGDVTTGGDQFFASSYVFNAGTTRPTGGNPALEPDAAHPGPTFGSLDATTVDLATATLETIDGVSVANVAAADGFLTLGDGGTLSANFAPSVPVGATLFMIAGEVGTQAGEAIAASVFVSDTPVATPEPAIALLTGLGLIGVASARRRARS